MLLLGCILAGPAVAQSPTPADTLPSLEEIRRERGLLRQEMRRIRSRVREISAPAQTLEPSAIPPDSVADHRALHIEQTERDLYLTRAELAHRRAVLYRRLRDIYKRGTLHSVQVLLTAESFSDLLNRYRYLHMIARHDRQLVREIAALETSLVASERLLQRRLEQLRDPGTGLSSP